MSRRIKLTDKKIKDILNEISARLKSSRMFDGELNVDYQDEDLKEGTALDFTSKAYLKMTALVDKFDTEVAWHGIASRLDDMYVIHDILVYPQEVSGATVNTDQEKYEQWLYSLSDDEFNYLRMQGHSHVNMSTSPSGVDTTHQERIIEQLGDEDFYIFIIWNKKGAHTVKIIDMAKNIIYFDKDIILTVEGCEIGVDNFIDEAKDMVTNKSSYKSKDKKGSCSTKPANFYGYGQQDWFDDEFFERTGYGK